MNGRLVMRAATVTAGIVLSRAADFDAVDGALLAAVVVAGGLGWWIDRAEVSA